MFEIKENLERSKIIPVIRENTYKEALTNAVISIEAGLNIIEITFTIPEAHLLIKEMIKKYKNKIIVGAGTILSLEDAKKATEAGAKFLVSPCFEKQVSDFCKEKNITYVPGCITPTEISRSLQEGWRIIKIFPGNLVGFDYLKSIKSVFKNLTIMVTGGVSENNIDEWFRIGSSILGIGTSLFKGSDKDIFKRIEIMKEKYEIK